MLTSNCSLGGWWVLPGLEHGPRQQLLSCGPWDVFFLFVSCSYRLTQCFSLFFSIYTITPMMTVVTRVRGSDGETAGTWNDEGWLGDCRKMMRDGRR